MKCSAMLRTSLMLALLAFTGGCSDDNEKATEGAGGGAAGAGTNSAGAPYFAGASNGGSSTNTGAAGAGANGGTVDAGNTAGTAGSSAGAGNAAGSSGSTAGAAPFAYFVEQANGTTTASLNDGVISVSSNYGSSGNAFKYASPNYYGTNSNGFIAFPTPLTGDFSISAVVTVTAQNKNNNASGLGVGMTTGFHAADLYAYMLMRNATTSTTSPGSTGVAYVSAATAVTMSTSPNVAWTNGSATELSFSRVGSNVTVGVATVGGTPSTQTFATSTFTNGTTAYGGGPVYPSISFNNLTAAISKLVVKDGDGQTLFDSDNGVLVTYVPASLTLSSSTASMKLGASTTVTATASAVGGAAAEVTAVAADPSIVGVTVTKGVTTSTIGLSGQKGGVTTITITNTSDPNPLTNTKALTVSVNDYPPGDAYGSFAARAYPSPGTADAYIDGELALTFDAPPTLNDGGSIKIFRRSDGVEIDSVAFNGELQVFGTTGINVGSQLVRVDGNTLYVTPHHGKLAYGTSYYVAIPTTAVTGTLNGIAFNGLSDLNSIATWSFTTRAAPTLDATNITVNANPNGTANFRTIQGALSAIATSLATSPNVTVRVAAGTYRELLRYTGPGLTSRQTIRISGPAGNAMGDNCVVQWTNGNTMNGSTQTRASFYFSGADLILENMTFRNTGLRAAVAQAETLYFAGGVGSTLAAYNSSFYGNQDTIQTSGRNWFYRCHIEGNVDFIWGTADAALFEDCALRVVAESTAAASYSMLVARTGTTLGTASGTLGKGYVLFNSTVNVDPNVTVYYGRNAGTGSFYDQAALVNVTFTGSGTIGAGLWNTATAPLSIGDSSYVGWKSANCSGLNLASLTTATGTSTTIADLATEYDTRDHILNRVVTVTAGVPTGYQSAATPWDLSTLATAWGAP